jgi:hypothetical protein
VPTGSFEPLPKPVRRRLPRDRFESLPIPKNIRHVDLKALAELSRLPFCEHCRVCFPRRQLENHHISSRGAGGGDEGLNTVRLCKGPCTNDCHSRAHSGLISRATLLRIAQARQQSDGE